MSNVILQTQSITVELGTRQTAVYAFLQSDVLLSGHRVVYINDLGKIDYASNTDYQKSSRVIGITTHAGSGLLRIQTFGLLSDDSFSFIPGSKLYLGENGELTTTYPTNGKCLLELGTAIDPKTIFIKIGTLIILK